MSRLCLWGSSTPLLYCSCSFFPLLFALVALLPYRILSTVLFLHRSHPAARNNLRSEPIPTRKSSTIPNSISLDSMVVSGDVVPSKVVAVAIGSERRSTVLVGWGRASSSRGVQLSGCTKSKWTDREKHCTSCCRYIVGERLRKFVYH